ncbi:MAG: M3 family metallopeptidase [Bdellovibrionales bacterium]|nr:M3 family metallopeptidase [Bdellovibrionales bacterium]
MNQIIQNIQSPSTPEDSFNFPIIKSEDFLPAVIDAINMAKEDIKKIEEQPTPSFKNTIEALELSGIILDKVTTLFFNLLHACSDDQMQDMAGPISEKLADHSNDILLDEKLFAKIKMVYDQKDSLQLEAEQSKLLEETFKSFRRNGALLSETDKEKLRTLDRELASLSPQFGNNLLKATNAFFLNVENEADVEGLPPSTLATAKEESEKRKLNGRTFTLQAPSYIPFMKFAKNRQLREKLWRAYNQKALDGEFSNRELCGKIATLRKQRAQILGYPTHAAFVLENRMAKTPQKVIHFIEDLKKPSFEAAQKEIEELRSFIKNDLREDIELQPWDFSYYSEKLKEKLFHFKEEDLRPYFPLEAVRKGIFIHGKKLYDLDFIPAQDIPVYHPDVEAFRVQRGDEFIGLLYLDFFPRDNKRSGAWMTNFREQGFDGKTVQRPQVSLVCNFTKPSKDHPSLLTFNEVQTLFHEFGHGLHSLLSHCYYRSLSGTNVLWDFVELPSQIMENWTYEKEALDLFAHHYQTGEAIPEDLVKKLKASSLFQAGYASVRQLSFALVDLAWHQELQQSDLDPVIVEEQSIKDLQLLPRIPGTNFSVSFSHVFAGGYSAGYYSYKWAEVLDADAFEFFKEKGIFNREVADRFYNEVLSRGGSADPEKLYVQFRGQEPDPKALLRRSGLL